MSNAPSEHATVDFASIVFPCFTYHHLPKRLRKRLRFGGSRTINYLVGTQPMTAPNGSTYSLKWRIRTKAESASAALEDAIQRRIPDNLDKGKEWKITLDEYRVLQPDGKLLGEYRDGDQLYFYWDIQFLSGSAGALLERDGEIVDSHVWVRA